MRVTIITSCYNREHTIRGCIESVLAQDYPGIEHIVVDGASTDGSLKIINEYKERIARLSLSQTMACTRLSTRAFVLQRAMS